MIVSFGNLIMTDLSSILIGFVLSLMLKKNIKIDPKKEFFESLDLKLNFLNKFGFISL